MIPLSVVILLMLATVACTTAYLEYADKQLLATAMKSKTTGRCEELKCPYPRLPGKPWCEGHELRKRFQIPEVPVQDKDLDI